jgi:alpha,alpha-trehalase
VNGWTLSYDTWDAESQRLREALCTLGNGYIATRGAAEESAAGKTHYPGTYLAGGYDRLPTEIAGRVIENEDLVNWPNWLRLSFRPEAGDWLDTSRDEVMEYRQTLDLKRGLLERILRVRDTDGRITRLQSCRIVSMADPHMAALDWTITPENWSGRLHIRSALDGTVTNAGVDRYGTLNQRHLVPLHERAWGEQCLELLVRSSQSEIRMAQVARTRCFRGGEELHPPRKLVLQTGYAAHEFIIDVDEGDAIRVEKVVAIHTSRDRAISEPADAAHVAVGRAGDFAALLRAHELAWDHLWARCDITIDGDTRAQGILRLHVFHLLQTASRNSIGLDMGVPARGWHGEAYRGHIFWDELFIFPFLNLRIPEITRSLLMYRYRRLAAARHRAKEAGLRGALFPWQSGSDGREETQVLHLNPRSGRWLPDESHRQYHVNSAIAYNVWQYYQATGDREFMEFSGAEMIVEIARMWASLAQYNEATGRYSIRRIMGPDEYHDAYPDAAEDDGGLDDNAYTNVMAAWVMRRADDVLAMLTEDRRDELCASLGIEDEEISHWGEVATRLHLPFTDDWLLLQFEGYDKLKELDWDAYRTQYGDIHRMDRILEAEGDSTNRYKLSKQADVLMLFYLFSTYELGELLESMGYVPDEGWVERNVIYYLERTSHGSTLSGVVHSWILARFDRERSWSLFTHALESDVADVQGGTTPEGIHLGAMAGTVDMVQRGYLGIEMHDDVLWLEPWLPDPIREITVSLRYREHVLGVHATHNDVRISFHRGRGHTALISVRGNIHEFKEGETKTFSLTNGEPLPG